MNKPFKNMYLFFIITFLTLPLFTNAQSNPLEVTCSTSKATINAGEQVVFSSTATGGLAPRTFKWEGSFSTNTKNARVQFDNPGTYTATVRVTDSGGKSAAKKCEIKVL